MNRFLPKTKKLKETSFLIEENVHCPATRRPGKHLEELAGPCVQTDASQGKAGHGRRLEPEASSVTACQFAL